MLVARPAGRVDGGCASVVLATRARIHWSRGGLVEFAQGLVLWGVVPAFCPSCVATQGDTTIEHGSTKKKKNVINVNYVSSYPCCWEHLHAGSRSLAPPLNELMKTMHHEKMLREVLLFQAAPDGATEKTSSGFVPDQSQWVSTDRRARTVLLEKELVKVIKMIVSFETRGVRSCPHPQSHAFALAEGECQSACALHSCTKHTCLQSLFLIHQRIHVTFLNCCWDRGLTEGFLCAVM